MGDCVLNGLKMACSGVADVLYVVDILNYRIIKDGWGIGGIYLKKFFKSPKDLFLNIKIISVILIINNIEI